MKREFNFKRSLPMSLLLSAVILFSQCQKDATEDFAPGVEALPSSTISAVSSGSTSLKSLDVSSFKSDGGKAYVIYQSFGTASDSNNNPEGSILKVYENGVELGAAHSKHADIRNLGKGRFSHWTDGLHFSTSDNSDPRRNGRKYTYSIGATTAVTNTTTTTAPVIAPAPTTAPSTGSAPIGYASVNGKTTGGLGGKTVTVSTLSALKSAAGSGSPMIIQVSGTITGTGSVYVLSNKTIVGLKGAVLNGVGFKIFNASNVIVQNLKIKNVVAGTDDNDCINIKYSHHIWVDHCELSADRNHGWEYWDGLLDITRQSDFVTVSNNVFHDSNIALLIGGGDADVADKGKLNVTIYKNYFYNISERQPRIRFGYVHTFNNYFKSTSGYCIASTMGAVVRTDNNYFEGANTPIRTTITGTAGFVSGAATNVYKGSGSNQITTSASNWTPTYEYKSALIPAANVASSIPASAGAIL